MARQFMDKNFLLCSPRAESLYHNHAARMPILDYHCHLSARDIAENRRFDNITKIWLSGDHYKWRAMRANGINEKYCTGDADDREKFLAWAQTLQSAAGNPLYHWAHLELKRFFGLEGMDLNEKTAPRIYTHCNSLMAKEEFTPQSIFKKMNVAALCTTDDPADSLEHHLRLKEMTNTTTKVFPTFRPDKAGAVDNPPALCEWLKKLQEASGAKVGSYGSLVEALQKRHEFFHSAGCRLSDHAVGETLDTDCTEGELEKIFSAALDGRPADAVSAAKFRTALLLRTGMMDAGKSWAMQLHIGALRNTNSRMFKQLGPDTGYDSMDDFPVARPLARFLDTLNDLGSLPKTVLYNLNPKDNPVLASMTGNFQDGGIPGKMQYGSAWWLLDTKAGIEDQLRAVSETGLLGRFIGMLTDSRSFLSYPRHEYFRRILCNMVGGAIEAGELADDTRLAGKLVEDVSYGNAARYLDLPGVKLP